MHYHVVLTVDGQQDCSCTFESWEDAEEMAAAISRQRDDWVPCRYPGRSWRGGEVAVYLDRRTGFAIARQEVVVIRCHAYGREPQPECQVSGRV